MADTSQNDVLGEDDINDPRVLRVLAKLTQHERNIVTERGYAGTTWADAAVACGALPDEGESLRRKVKRLSKLSGGESAQGGRSRTDEGVLPTGTVG